MEGVLSRGSDKLRSVIPSFNDVMRPMLDALADGSIRDTVWLRDEIAKRFDVTPEERVELLPSGTGRLFDNRVAWAYVHLQQAKAIERVARANYRITPRGAKLLAENPERIDTRVLSQFPELVAFRKGGKGRSGSEPYRPRGRPIYPTTSHRSSDWPMHMPTIAMSSRRF